MFITVTEDHKSELLVRIEDIIIAHQYCDETTLLIVHNHTDHKPYNEYRVLETPNEINREILKCLSK